MKHSTTSKEAPISRLPTIKDEHADESTKEEEVYESTTLLGEDYSAMAFSSEFPTNQCMQFYILLRKMLTQIMRNSTALKVQLIHYFLCGFIVGVLYYGTANEGTQFYGHLKLCVSVIVFFGYTHLMIPVLLCKYLSYQH